MIKTTLSKTLTLNEAALDIVTSPEIATSPAQALCIDTLCTLADGNSLLEIDVASQQGLFTWEVDLVNQAAQEWFWYRIGDSAEASIDTLALTSLATPDDNTLTATWQGSSFDLEVEWVLQGGASGSGNSQIEEQISITNTTENELEFYFFEYTDLDLTNTFDDDFYVIDNINTVKQFDELTRARITQFSGDAEEIRYEIAPFPDLLDSLNDASPTNLSNTPAFGTVVGPGDEPFALQWKFTIDPDETVSIAKTKQISEVPETIAFDVFGNVDITKAVDFELNKFVTSNVNVDNPFATAQADAEAFGVFAFAETDAFATVNDEFASSYSEAIAAIDQMVM